MFNKSSQSVVRPYIEKSLINQLIHQTVKVCLRLCKNNTRKLVLFVSFVESH